MQRRMPKGTVAHGQIDPMRIEIPMDEANKGRPLIFQQGINRCLNFTPCAFANSRNRPHGCDELEQISSLFWARINLGDKTRAETYRGMSILSAETCEAEIKNNHLKGRDYMPRVPPYPQGILYRDLTKPQIICLQIPMI